MSLFTRAIVRTPGADFADGLTTAGLGRPTLALMLSQHQAYLSALRSLGLEVTVLEPLAGFPDAYFVEDAAVVTLELAVITRPGAAPRRGEELALASVLAAHKPTAAIAAPGALEGGDVLIVERQVFIGVSTRTNAEGAAQLGRLLEPQGFRWTPIALAEGLHLKSFVNTLGGRRIIVSDELASRPAFAPFERVVVDVGETYACNVLLVNGTLLVPAGFPRTLEKLRRLGMRLIELDTSEARRMDGGLTCLSLRF